MEIWLQHGAGKEVATHGTFARTASIGQHRITRPVRVILLQAKNAMSAKRSVLRETVNKLKHW